MANGKAATNSAHVGICYVMSAVSSSTDHDMMNDTTNSPACRVPVPGITGDVALFCQQRALRSHERQIDARR